MPAAGRRSEKLWLQNEAFLPAQRPALRTASGKSWLSLRSRPLHRIPFRKILQLLPRALRRAQKLFFVLVGIVNQDAVIVVGGGFQPLVGFIPLRGNFIQKHHALARK